MTDTQFELASTHPIVYDFQLRAGQIDDIVPASFQCTFRSAYGRDSVCRCYRGRSLRVQLSPEYRKWLDEDICWIMKPQERRQFLNLTSNQSRNQFVIDFWERSDAGEQREPFKKEHYQRLAFSNEHFAAGVAGSKTDRGRIYVVYGPPDSIVTHDSSSTSPRDEVWLYRHMKGGGDEVTLKFVDDCYCGDYSLQNEPPNSE